jgi:cytidylate kinase
MNDVPEATRMPAHVPVIAIDGPSGVGKGMVTRWIAEELRWHRLDSGALYRILALAAQKAGIDLADARAVAALAPTLDIRFVGTTEHDEIIRVGGADWTVQIRAETTGALASRIAAAAEVRTALLQRQRDFREPPGLVADGRDMGTVVFPDADLKIFLDASIEARAHRRWLQLRAAGINASLIDLCTEVRKRDERDRTRSVAPLRPAEDAVLIETTHLSPAEVLDRIGTLVAERGFLSR